MYELKEPTLAKLFVSLIFAPQADSTLCTKSLIDKLGPVDYMSGEMKKLFVGFFVGLRDIYMSKLREAGTQ